MARPSSAEQIPDLPRAIRETAWRQIASRGAPALSLRAIARELGITAPAIYNYYRRRDDLVTALIVEAFTSLGECLEYSLSEQPEDGHQARFTSLGLAYRDWAITYPQRYQLIFGTPIPNYQAPPEDTIPAAAASLMPLIETLQACQDAGLLQVERYPELVGDLRSMLEDWSEMAEGMDLEVLYTALVVWSRVHGLVALEIGQQYPVQITNPDLIYRREIKLMVSYYLEGSNTAG